MNLCVVGAGYVGLTAAAAWAHQGHRVACVEIDEERLVLLTSGRLPFKEPGLEELYLEGREAGRLRFTPSLEAGVCGADLVFIAVGTPSRSDGSVDLKSVERVAAELRRTLTRPAVVVIKSTVPVGTAERVEKMLNADSGDSGSPGPVHTVLSNPEFLREGSSLRDFLKPDRVVIGADPGETAAPLVRLYEPLGAPLLVTSRRNAEMIKYAANAFLATKISFINELSALCEELGVDVTEVAQGMGLDRRIAPHFLRVGVGYGGSCFPKDVAALLWMYREKDLAGSILQAAAGVNEEQRRRAVGKVRRLLGGLEGRRVAVLGLSFKPETDDVRGAPALDIARSLLAEGATVSIYDPAWGLRAERILPGAAAAKDPYEAAAGADALLLLTEWEEFRQLDPVRLRRVMRQPVVVDGRNWLDGESFVEQGFLYEGFGRLTPGGVR